jgi:hypothetical protein
MALKSKKIEYDNGQTKSSENEQKLLSPTKNFSIHLKNIEMLSKNKHICFEKEPIIEKIFIGNTNQRSRQYRECATNRLAKIGIPHIIISPDSSDSENYTEVRQ